jgi:hypothetical protein
MLIVFVMLLSAVAFLFVAVKVIVPWKERRAAATKGDADTPLTLDDDTGPKKKRTDARRLGYRYAEDEPFFFIKGSGVWTGVILESTTDEYDTPEEQEATVDRMSQQHAAVLSHFQSELGDECQVRCHELVRYQPVNVDAWREEYNQSNWNPSNLFNSLIDEHVTKHVAESTPERRRILLIKLGEFTGPVDVDPASYLLNRVDHVVEEHFSSADLESFREKAAHLQALLFRYGASAMRRSDLAWLIRKPLSGHFDPDTERDYDRTRPWRNGYFDQMVDLHGRNLTNAVEIQEPHPVTAEPRKSYTTTLIIADSPAEVPFRYSKAWGKVLRTLPRRVEVSWRYTLVSEKLWKSTIQKKIRLLVDEDRDRAKAGMVGDTKFDERLGRAQELGDEVALAPTPVMIGQLRLSISAPTLRGLNKAVQDVQSVIGDVKLDRKRRIQYALLEEQLPGDPDELHIGKWSVSKHTGGMNIGTRWTDLESLSIARLDSSPTVGDSTEQMGRNTLGWHGHVIGYSQENGALVHFDPHVQVARNKGAGVAILGASGGGKSGMAMSLFFWVSESGTQTVVADPKNDIERFCYFISFGRQILDPDFKREAETGLLGTSKSKFTVINKEFFYDTDIIDLFRGKRGMLDAWSLTSTYAAGESLARSQMEQLIPDKVERAVLDPAFRAMRNAYHKAVEAGEDYIPCLSNLESYLGDELEFYRAIEEDKSQQSARIDAHQNIATLEAVRDRLNRAADKPYSRLLFGRGDGAAAFTDVTKRRTVITLFGFKPPANTDATKWGESERDAAAAMFTALFRINEFFTAVEEGVSPNTGRRGTKPRALFVDEGYMITRIEAGKDLMSRATRQGRSLYFVVVFISQQASDISELENKQAKDGEADINQFGTIFVFRQKTLAEARSALSLLRDRGSDDDDDREMLASKLLEESDGGSLRTGVCVMRDVDNRVATIRIDPMFVELFAATQTNASVRSESQDIDITADGARWHLDPSARDQTRTGILAEHVEEGRRMVAFEYDDYEQMVDDA